MLQLLDTADNTGTGLQLDWTGLAYICSAGHISRGGGFFPTHIPTLSTPSTIISGWCKNFCGGLLQRHLSFVQFSTRVSSTASPGHNGSSSRQSPKLGKLEYGLYKLLILSLLPCNETSRYLHFLWFVPWLWLSKRLEGSLLSTFRMVFLTKVGL